MIRWQDGHENDIEEGHWMPEHHSGGVHRQERLEFLRALFPVIADRVDRAYRASAGTSTQEPTDAIDSWLDQEVRDLHANVLPGVGFASIPDEPTREVFTSAFRATQTIASWGGIDVPTPESLTSVGVNLEQLGSAAATDATLQPVPAPYGLGLGWWQHVYERAVTEIGRPLRGAGLLVAAEIGRGFEQLDQVPQLDTPRFTPDHHGHRSPNGPAAEPRYWTLRLIPASATPTQVGLSFGHGPHVSLPEMLMMQLIRLVQGRPLVDEHSFTWIAGELAEGKLAARHIFDTTEGVVRLSAREPGQQGPHLGARPPVG